MLSCSVTNKWGLLIKRELVGEMAQFIMITRCIVVVCLTVCLGGCGVMGASQKASYPANYNSIFFGDSLVDSANVTEAPVLPTNYLPPVTANNYWMSYHYSNFYLKRNDAQYNSSFHGAPLTSLSTDFSEGEANATRPTWVNYLLEAIEPKNQTLYTYRYITTVEPEINFAHANVDMAYASAETGSRYLSDLSTTQSYSPYVNCSAPGVMSMASGAYSCVPGVIAQIALYEQLLNDQKINSQNTHPTSNTRYFIWAGANDLANNIAKLAMLSSTADQKGFNFDKFQSYSNELLNGQARCVGGYLKIGSHEFSCIAKNIRAAVLKLENAPGIQAQPNQIYVLNLPDLSQVPKMQAVAWAAAMHATTEKGPVKSMVEKRVIYKAILKIIQKLSVTYNERLQAELTSTGSTANSGDVFKPLQQSHIYPVYQALDYLLSNPRKFGFKDHKNKVTHGLASCVGNEALEVDSQAWIKGSHTEPGPNQCHSYVFYNSVHPSNHGHRCVALGLKVYMDSSGERFIPDNC